MPPSPPHSPLISSRGSFTTSGNRSPVNERTPLRPTVSNVSTATGNSNTSSPRTPRQSTYEDAGHLRPRMYGVNRLTSREHGRPMSSTTSLQSYHRTHCPQHHNSHEPCEHGDWSPHASPESSRSGSRAGQRDDAAQTEEGVREGQPLVIVEAEDEAGRDGHDSTENGQSDVPGGQEPHHVPPNERGALGGKHAGNGDLTHRLLGDMVTEGILGRFGGNDAGVLDGAPDASAKKSKDVPPTNGDGNAVSTTQWLADRHGVRNRRKMYLAYYIPFLNWIRQYRWSFFQGDLIAALTMASFYIPMSLSYAANLGHIPPINGLYSFVFNPFIYAILGTCPQMVVGPEAAGSLLVGSVVKSSVDKVGREDDEINARIAGVVTGIAGAVIFIAGLTRLGFLESVLSRPFLRGFISAIGIVILVDQLIPETGLAAISKHDEASHGSSFQKLQFLFSNIHKAHGATCAVAFGSFAIIMFCRQMKKYLQPRYPKVAYIPDRFIVVVLSAVFAWRFDWDGKGIEILGDIESSSGSAIPFRFPLIPSHMTHIREAMSTSFLIALLGFFESSVAAKSLGGTGSGSNDGLKDISMSANRELVALGVANIVGGCFMALPAFGGYGRSKVNASTGGKTPMSSIFLSIISVICVFFLLPYFYYIPKAVLSAMISVVAYSLMEEAPHDIKFFIKIRGWTELTLMTIIFVATIFYSLPLGIALGIGLSILQVIQHATKPRIQILGKVPGSSDQFENAEDNPQGVEFIEGCLIVKIPEPLTFANTGDLKNRLRRLELYGTTAAHPALPRVRDPEHNKNIIFDVHGVTSIDGSGTQVLTEIVDSYRARGERVYFCRVPRKNSKVYEKFIQSGIVDRAGGHQYFMRSVEEALQMAERDSNVEDYFPAYRD